MARRTAAKRASGRSLTDAERAATGRGRLTLRPRVEYLDDLDTLARRWECSRCDAFEIAVRKALDADV